MFPVSDVIPARATPVVTIGLIAMSTVVALAGGRLDSASGAPLAWAALAPLLHAGWLHLAGNTLSLWIFGGTVEDAMGRVPYLAFYGVVSAVATAAHALVLGLAIPPPGAAAAVAGIIGAYVVLYPRSRVLLAVYAVTSLELIEIPALYVIGVWVVVQALALLTARGMTPLDASIFVPHALTLAAGALTGLWLKSRVRWE